MEQNVSRGKQCKAKVLDRVKQRKKTKQKNSKNTKNKEINKQKQNTHKGSKQVPDLVYFSVVNSGAITR